MQIQASKENISMTNNWVIDENNKTITHKLSGLIFKWHITPAGVVVLAPFPHPVANEDASYVSLLKEAIKAGAENTTSPENKAAFRKALRQHSK